MRALLIQKDIKLTVIATTLVIRLRALLIQKDIKLIGDLRKVLQEIFKSEFLCIFNLKRKELYKIDMKNGIVLYKNFDGCNSLVNLIFIKRRMILIKIELNQDIYY